MAAGQSIFEIVMIERHNGLASRLRYDGAGIINRCFLEYAEETKGKIEFPRVLMNPPFSKTRQHIVAALSLLGPGGHCGPATLVALVPITFQHEEAETLEELSDTTFSTAKVRTKIIRIRRG